MRTPTYINPGLNIVSERDFLFPNADEEYCPEMLAYLHRQDLAPFFVTVGNEGKTPEEVLELPRFSYLSEKEKAFCVRAFAELLIETVERPMGIDHLEKWLKAYER